MLILECTEAQEMCRNLEPFLNVVKVFLEILRWTVPILLIVLGTIDMFNAATKAEDEKVVQDARRKLIKRIIYGIVVFLVPLIINIIMDLVVESGIKDENNITPNSWVSCWTGKIDTKGCKDIYEPDPEPSTTCNCKICVSEDNCRYSEMVDEICKTKGGTCEASDAGNACYVWNEYTCSVEGTEYDSDSNYNNCVKKYPLTDNLLKKWYEADYNYNKNKLWENVKSWISSGDTGKLAEYASPLCKENLGVEPYKVKFTSRNIGGSNGQTTTAYYFVCIYEKKLVKKAETTPPSKTTDGTYKEYTCKTHKCDTNAKSFCSGETEKRTSSQ